MSKPSLFPRLFEPASIGKLRLRNHLVMLPMGTAYASLSGEATQRTIDHYVERAKGGVSVITVGNVSPYLPNGLNQLALDSAWLMMSHHELVEKVHAEGAKIIAQLNHPGRQKYAEVLQPGEERISSSPLPMTWYGQLILRLESLARTRSISLFKDLSKLQQGRNVLATMRGVAWCARIPDKSVHFPVHE